MKKLLILAAALIAACELYAGKPDPGQSFPENTDSLTYPAFRGEGAEAFRQWAMATAFPDAKPGKGSYRKAIVRFTVDTGGRLRHPMLAYTYGIDTAYANKIIAVISSSPLWSPATKYGIPVDAVVAMNIWRGKLPVHEYSPVYCRVYDRMPPPYNPKKPQSMPYFPYGKEKGFMNWVGTQIQTSPVGVNRLYGEAYMQFVVQKDGSIGDIIILSTNNRKLAAEAVRILEGCPLWVPGKVDGVPVNVSYCVPVVVK